MATQGRRQTVVSQPLSLPSGVPARRWKWCFLLCHHPRWR